MTYINGKITLHRKILNWEWYQDSNTTRLFIHCLLKANWKVMKWQGKTIERGQFITSRENLSTELKLSVQQIRTSLNKLKSTSEITIKTTNKNTIITVNNYNEYQESNQQDNNQITNNQPTNNQQITTNEKYKEHKKNKEVKDIYSVLKLSSDDVSNLKEHRIAKKSKLTKRACELLATELDKAEQKGYNRTQCIDLMIEKGWTGFKAEWLDNQKVKGGNKKYPDMPIFENKFGISIKQQEELWIKRHNAMKGAN